MFDFVNDSETNMWTSITQTLVQGTAYEFFSTCSIYVFVTEVVNLYRNATFTGITET